MNTIQETLQDGACRLFATLPASRAELDKAFAALSTGAAMEMMERAVYAWWYHTAPKSSKGVPVPTDYGSPAKPLSLSDIMERAALAPSRDSGPSKKDAADATAKLKQWMAEWEATLPQGTAEAPAPEITATMRQEAMKARTIARAAELKAEAFPKLQWAWQASGDLSYNAAMLCRAIRLYKGSVI